MGVSTGRLRIVSGSSYDDEEDAETVVKQLPLAEAGSSPGDYIRQVRLRQGLSIEELAQRTKISPAKLNHLENNAFEQLPGPVFVKGFLRCCARALDVQADTVLRLFYEQERLTQAKQEAENSVQLSAAPKSRTSLAASSTKLVRPSLQQSPKLQQVWNPQGGVRTLMWVAVAVLFVIAVLSAFAISGEGSSILSQS